MTHTDLDAVFELVNDFVTSFFPDRTAFEASFEQLHKDESTFLHVAEIEGEGVIGYCLGFDHVTFYANGRVSWVEEITVAEKMRGQTIGRQLMEAFEAWAIDRGSALVALATRRAAPFYTALGYEDSATYFRKLMEPKTKKAR
jgi:GNAT superfamily N-acetyltransferase